MEFSTMEASSWRQIPGPPASGDGAGHSVGSVQAHGLTSPTSHSSSAVPQLYPFFAFLHFFAGPGSGRVQSPRSKPHSSTSQAESQKLSPGQFGRQPGAHHVESMSPSPEPEPEPEPEPVGAPIVSGAHDRSCGH